MNFKNLLLIAATTSLCSILPAGSAFADDAWQNRVSVLVGQKKLDQDDFSDDTQGTFGIMADIKRSEWPVSIALDLIAAGQETNVDGRELSEVTGGFHIGVRKYWQLENQYLEPFVGGGVNLAVAEQERLENNRVITEDDTDVGYWLAAGMNIRLDKHFVIGAQIRYSDAEAELFNTQLDTGGVYSLLSVGYAF